MIARNRVLGLSALAAMSVLALSACSAPGADEAASTTAAQQVIAHDVWIKTAESGMTAGFGELVNEGSTEVTVSRVSTDASAISELHETVQDDSGTMVMRQVEGGFSIAAGETLTLAPAGNHLMLMDLTGPLTAGDEVSLTLEFSDGSDLEVQAVVKDYSGANENYDGGHGTDSGEHGEHGADGGDH